MKAIKYIIAISIWILGTGLYAQETTGNSQLDSQTEKAIEKLEDKRNGIVEKEKEKLRKQVEKINTQLENGEIDAVRAEVLKREAAEKHALNIENRIAIIDNTKSLLERNETVEKSDFKWDFNFGNTDNPDEIHDHDYRTHSYLVFSLGLNNAIIDGQSLDDSPYKIGGSRYTEIGLAWSTRVFKDAGWLRFKYGFSFQFNGLKPTNDRYFVSEGNTTVLEEFPANLDKAKLRMDNLVVPIHFEFGPANRKEKNGKTYFNTHNKFKIGVGGYAGLNLSTRQKLKFEDAEGIEVKQKLKDDYNTNNFIYGVSGYIGFDTLSLYAKYDLNTIFKGAGPEQRNISLGLRWDMY